MAVIPFSYRPSIAARSDAATPLPSQLLADTDEATSVSTTQTDSNTLTSKSVDEAIAPTNQELSTGAKAGIGISVAIIILSIIALVTWFTRRYMRRRRYTMRMQALRRESERGMQNVANFQLALPPKFLEDEDASLLPPPKSPPTPPEPVAKPPTKRGFSWLNEKEVVVDWRATMGSRLSRWREKPSANELDTELKKVESSADTDTSSWI